MRTESRALVNPVVAPPEAGEDLVADGAHGGGEVVDAHAFADQRGELAPPRGALGEIGDINGEEVHRHVAGDRTTLAGDDDLGCGFGLGDRRGRPQEAIGITGRDDGNTGRPSGDEGRAVAYALA